MPEPGYEYYGLMAKTWDLFRGDTSRWSDRFFYLEMIRKYGQPVLDVGCGTGRLLLDYLTQGIDIDGVDNSPEMLAICREKAIELGVEPSLFEQTMETLALTRQYRTILVPSSSFQLVTDRGLAQRAMERFAAHLLPGGALVLPFMVLWQYGSPLEADWKVTAEITGADGITYLRWSRFWYDPQEELEHTEDRYETVREGQVVDSEYHRQSPATRSYSQAQVRALFEDAGLVDLQLFHEFSLDPASAESTLFTVVGIKPAENA